MIRPEREGEATAVAAVHRDAFGRELEPSIVDRVRPTGAYIPSLSLVYEDDGRILGHVLVSWAAIANGGPRVLLLGPLGVLPACQGKGIGGALVRAALAAARELGEPCVVLEGNPKYYARLGFVRADAFGLLPPEGTPDWAFQVAVLGDEADLPQGRLVYPPGFPD